MSNVLLMPPNGYARATGRTGVCMANSGPRNQPDNGIANAYMDSIPIVAITGQVSTAEEVRFISGGRYNRHHFSYNQT